MYEYFCIGIAFACLNSLCDMLYSRYMLPRILDELKINPKEKEDTIYKYGSTSINGIATTVVCWPAVLIYTILTIVVWAVKAIIDIFHIKESEEDKKQYLEDEELDKKFGKMS